MASAPPPSYEEIMAREPPRAIVPSNQVASGKGSVSTIRVSRQSEKCKISCIGRELDQSFKNQKC